jgi:hypothetical protein
MQTMRVSDELARPRADRSGAHPPANATGTRGRRTAVEASASHLGCLLKIRTWWGYSYAVGPRGDAKPEGMASGSRSWPESLVGALEREFERGAFGVAGFGDDDLGQAGFGVLVVAVGAVEQQDGVGVLFQGAGVS